MKPASIIFSLLLFSFLAGAQLVFKTIVPVQPVIVGESFPVQYVIEDAEKVSGFFAPDFKGFSIVTSPYNYTGSVNMPNRVKKIKNTVYTLSALRPGHYTITGAVATVNGMSIRSNDAVIEVISKEEAVTRMDKDTDRSNSGSYLKPGEDPYKKMGTDLYMQVTVDKHSCFTGEPVLATFKLYSRLQSKSDIVKNPGFYGFTVYDMISLADKQLTNENINGQLFDVHTIRKVQLYPLQPGRYIIDAMEVESQVAFSKTPVSKKAEQEITEGVLINKTDEKKNADTEIFSSSISTEPVQINVKPLPEKNKPADFKDAVGNFIVTAAVSKNKLVKNEEAILELTISGRGNFIQLEAPAIQWPAGIEGFEPLVKDSLNKTQAPLQGKRIFRYAFVAADSGTYTIPAVVFSFFNPDSGTYKIITTQALSVSVVNDKKLNEPVLNNTINKKTKNSTSYSWVAGFVLLTGLTVIALLYQNKKRRIKSSAGKPEKIQPVLSLDEMLAPASLFSESENKNFYSLLHQSVWLYFAQHFTLAGSMMNKENLLAGLKAKAVPGPLVTEVDKLLQELEAGMFANADAGMNRSELLNRTKKLLEEIKTSLL